MKQPQRISRRRDTLMHQAAQEDLRLERHRSMQMADALRKVNELVFGSDTKCGSAKYFTIRNLIVDTLKACGERVS